MIHLKVSLTLGGDPYDQARVDGIEAFVRETLADGLAMEREWIEVSRLPCSRELGAGKYVTICGLPSGHEGGHSSVVARS